MVYDVSMELSPSPFLIERRIINRQRCAPTSPPVSQEAPIDKQLAPSASLGPTIRIPTDLRKNGDGVTDLFFKGAQSDTLWNIAERLTGDSWNHKGIVR